MNQQQPFITLVDQILAAKNPPLPPFAKGGNNTDSPLCKRGDRGDFIDTSALEQQIDKMVYKLYDLTEEEIAIVEESKMTIIGLTGNYGMGKSTVALMFGDLGAVVIDTDDIVCELLKDSAVMYEIKKAFGEGIIQQSAVSSQPPEINKKMLADIVFEHPDLRISLEDILHPRVFEKIDKKIKKLPENSIVIIEAPVIFERGYQNRFERIMTVFTDEDTAAVRLKKKGIPEDEAAKRLKSQFSVQMKISKSDYAIDNSRDLENTRRQVEEVYKSIVNSQWSIVKTND